MKPLKSEVLNNRNLKIFKQPGIAQFLAVLFLVFSSCEETPHTVEEVVVQKVVVVETGRDVKLIYSDFGQHKVEIVATTMKRHLAKEPFIEFPDGLRLYFYNGEGEIDSRLSANYGIGQEKDEEMTVSDDVVIVNLKGEKLNTEELIWKQKDGKIYSDKFVKITTEDEIIFGEGLEATEDFSEYTIKNIKGTIQLENDVIE